MNSDYSGLKPKKDFLLAYAFLGLCVIVFCNLNAMMAMTLGIKSMLTPFLLIFSLIVIGRSVFYTSWIRNSGILMFTFALLGSYIYISLISLILFPENLHEHTSIIRLFRKYFSSFLVIGAFYCGTIYFIKRRGHYFLLRVLIILFLVTSAFTAFTHDIGVANLYAYASDSLREGSRQSGLFGNPNEAGNFGAYFLVLLLAGVLMFKKFKLIPLFLIPLALYSILVSFSKAAIGIGIAVLIFYFLFNIKNVFKIGRSNRTILFFIITIFITANIWIFANWNNIYNSFDQGQQKRVISFVLLLQGEVSERTTSDRTITFQQGWNLIKKSPLIGNGFGSFHRFVEGKIQLGVHNTYLLILGEAGILPLLLFLGLLVLLSISVFHINDNATRFIVLGFCLVFFVSVAALGHNALYDRVSNGMLGIVIGLISSNKS